MAAAIQPINTRIIWSWQSDPFQRDTHEEGKWDRYSDFEIEEIERGYEQEMDTIHLHDRIVDLNFMIQINNIDGQTTRVKREEVDARNYFRKQRFCYVEQPGETLGIGVWNPEFIIEWERRFEILIGRQFNYPNMAPQIVEQAARGILTEARQQGKEFDGKKIHDKLMEVRNSELRKVGERCVLIYTIDSFLYPLLNSTLRTNDFSKIDTLGAFCHLLWYYLYTGDEENRILFRGTVLSNDIIDEYKQAKAKGKPVKSLAFTSASKDPEVAGVYGTNTLFIITAKSHPDNANWCKDVSSISNYADEQEVLITAGHPFIVDRVDFENEKHFIYLTLSS